MTSVNRPQKNGKIKRFVSWVQLWVQLRVSRSEDQGILHQMTPAHVSNLLGSLHVLGIFLPFCDSVLGRNSKSIWTGSFWDLKLPLSKTKPKRWRQPQRNTNSKKRRNEVTSYLMNTDAVISLIKCIYFCRDTMMMNTYHSFRKSVAIFPRSGQGIANAI